MDLYRLLKNISRVLFYGTQILQNYEIEKKNKGARSLIAQLTD